MNQPSNHPWEPDPQLLAAYFDGELADCAEGAEGGDDVRARIEAWLLSHPEAAEESDALKKLWLETTPAEPTPAQWNAVLDRIDARRPARPAAPPRRPWLYFAAAASVVLFLGAFFGASRFLQPPQPGPGPVAINPGASNPDDLEVLQVALASEVTILRMEGPETDAVVVGAMPVAGSLELADSGEVCISCKCPRVHVRQDPPHRPMVWARASAD